MEDPAPPVQTDEQPKAGPRVEEMLVDPILESPGARQSAEESAAAASGLGSGEQLAPTMDGSTMIPGATAETARSSAASVGDVGATPESGAAKPMVPEEQPAPPEASQGMVGPAV